MSDEPWIIPIPNWKSDEIAKIAVGNVNNVFWFNTILKGIPDFPDSFLAKIRGVAVL